MSPRSPALHSRPSPACLKNPNAPRATKHNFITENNVTKCAWCGDRAAFSKPASPGGNYLRYYECCSQTGVHARQCPFKDQEDWRK